MSTDVDSKELCFSGNRNNDNLRLVGSSGTLNAPPKYPAGLICTWLISVPEGKMIKLSFTKFDLNWHAGTCGDYVEVLDGRDTSSKSLEKYCAYEGPTPRDVLSSGRYMKVMFRAEYKRRYFELPNQREGFVASFKAVNKEKRRKYYPKIKCNLIVTDNVI